MNEKIFGKSEVLFREGEQGTCFYQITEGRAGVYLHYGEADQRKLTEMVPGQYFGEIAIIGAWPRSATIVAEEELHVIELTGKDLDSYFENQPGKILALINQLGDRLRTLTEEYDDVCAFIRDRQSSGAEKKEGFLTRWKKYKEISAFESRLKGCTVEETIRAEDSGKAALPVKVYNKGQIIFRDGDEGAYMYQIHSGAVSIYARYDTPEATKLTTLYTNAFFGEMGLVGQKTRSAAAVVEEDGTTLECIRREDLQELFRTNPPEVYKILEHLTKRLRKLTLDYVAACRTAVEDT